MGEQSPAIAGMAQLSNSQQDMTTEVRWRIVQWCVMRLAGPVEIITLMSAACKKNNWANKINSLNRNAKKGREARWCIILKKDMSKTVTAMRFTVEDKH